MAPRSSQDRGACSRLAEWNSGPCQNRPSQGSIAMRQLLASERGLLAGEAREGRKMPIGLGRLSHSQVSLGGPQRPGQHSALRDFLKPLGKAPMIPKQKNVLFKKRLKNCNRKLCIYLNGLRARTPLKKTAFKLLHQQKVLPGRTEDRRHGNRAARQQHDQEWQVLEAGSWLPDMQPLCFRANCRNPHFHKIR